MTSPYTSKVEGAQAPPRMNSCPYCGMEKQEELGVVRREVAVMKRTLTIFNGACSCGAQGPDAGSLEEAIEKWNSRAAPKDAKQKAGDCQLTIWKFPFRIADEQEIDMPEGAKILSVGTQYERPCIWALVNSARNRDEPRTILMRGTGHPANDTANARFIGTITMSCGRFTFHVFEKGGSK